MPNPSKLGEVIWAIAVNSKGHVHKLPGLQKGILQVRATDPSTGTLFYLELGLIPELAERIDGSDIQAHLTFRVSQEQLTSINSGLPPQEPKKETEATPVKNDGEEPASN